MKRSIDYLETRPDINMEKLAYFGISWGGECGAQMLSIQDRFKTGILVLAGVKSNPTCLPGQDSPSYLPRVTAPVLLLNGKYDTVFPYEISQKPFFELLGTPANHKKMILYNEGHQVPRDEMIKESLNWLDTYLGQVEPGS